MVAIVSSNALGLQLGSLSALGAQGQIGSAAAGQNGESAYVNVATGNLVLQDVDGFLAGLGPDFTDLRTYNSMAGANFTNNDGWMNGGYKSIAVVPSSTPPTLERTDSDGSMSTYVLNSAGVYVETVSDGGPVDQIVLNGSGSYTWTNGATGATETYSAVNGSTNFLLTSAADTSGNTLTYHYTGTLLTSVTTTDVGGGSETVNFAYTGNNLTSMAVTLNGSAQPETLVTYGYDTQNRLKTVSVTLNPGTSDTSTYLTTYGYASTNIGDDRIASITQSDGTSLTFAYVSSTSSQIQSVTDGQGNKTTFSYGQNSTTVTDPLNAATVYQYDSNGQLVQITTPKSQTTYSYNSLGEVATVEDGLGNVTTYQYDAKGNCISQVDGAGDTVTQTYTANNQLSTSTVYLTPAGGGTAAGNGQTTRYVYATNNPYQLRFIIGATGDVTQYGYNPQGLRTSAVTYSGASYAAGTSVPSEATMVNWASTLPASQSASQSIAYQYDFRGQLMSSTVSDPATGTSAKTSYVYDFAGRLLQTINPDGTSTQVIYDELGRVKQTIVQGTAPDPATGVSTTTVTTTTNTYSSLHVSTTVKYTVGGSTSTAPEDTLTTVSTFDAAGRLISVQQETANSPTTTYSYDADGRLVMTTDPTGVRSWMLYDTAGRKVADLSGAGVLTEYVYNADDQVTQTIAYATAVQTGTLSTTPALSTIRPTALPGQDQTSWNYYDAAGRLSFQVDALGNVTQTQYDGASNVISVTKFATPLTPTALAALGTGTVTAPGTQPTRSTVVLTTSAAGTIAAGAQVTLTAKVAGSSPTGVVVFFNNGVMIGTATVSGGLATLKVSDFQAGQASLSVEYLGDSANTASTTEVVQTIAPAASVLTLATSLAPSTVSQGVTLVAEVSGGAGNAQPTGQVKFYRADGTQIGTAAVSNGQAKFVDPTATIGTSNYYAVYVGDSNNATATSQSVAATVVADTSIGLNAYQNNGAVFLVASLSGGDGAGTISFFNGGVLIGSAAVSNGQATLVLPSLQIAAGGLQAVYSGDAGSASSTSTLVSGFTASGAQATTTTLTVPGGPTVSGGTTTLTANVVQTQGHAPVPDGVVLFFDGATVIGSGLVSNGVATLTISNQVGGSHSLTAQYLGDALNSPSAPSSAVTEVVGKATSSATFTVSAAAVAQGAPVTLLAQITGSSGQALPSGSVRFYDGTTLLGSATLSGGQASLTLPELAVGPHSLSIQYDGDASNTAITPATAAITVLATTSTTLQAFGNGAVTLQATVSDPNATGTVNFFNGAQLVGSAAVVDGVAILNLASLTIAGGLTAVYSGDAKDATSRSAAVSAIVPTTNLPSSTSLGFSGSTTSGGVATLTATVSGQGAAPTGVVIFYETVGGVETAIGTATLHNGVASLSVNDLAAGANTLAATYLGDATNASSTSAAVNQQIDQAATSTALALSTTQPAPGAPVRLVAQIAGSSGLALPTGTVDFYDGAVLLGTGTLSNGIASLTLDNGLGGGNHQLTAHYEGDPNNASSISAISSVTVATPTTTTLTTTDNGLVALTASISDGAATGTVSFFNGDELIGSATVVDGVATLLLPTITVAAGGVKAVYSGDAAFGSSVSTSTTTIAPPGIVGTETSLTFSGSTVSGGAATLTATVTSLGTDGETPTGVVVFSSYGKIVGSAVVGSDGTATLQIHDLPGGDDSLVATYLGDAGNAASASTAVDETITQATASVVIDAGTSPVNQGQPITLVAQVSGSAGIALPNGTVTFYDGTTELGTATIQGNLAVLDGVVLPAGSHNITASYIGDSSNTAATSAVSKVVVLASTTTSLAGIQDMGNGEAVLTATVTGSSPGGTVSFFDGGTLIGSAVVVNGVATLVSLTLGGISNAGATAVYSGDAVNAASTSASISSLVATNYPALTIIPSSFTPAAGSTETINCFVSGQNLTGLVTFYNGTTVLGTSSVSASGEASLTLTGITPGMYDITATYSGDPNNLPSANVAAAPIIVAPYATSISVSSSASSAASGAPVTLTAHVAGGSSPTGTVTFYNGTTILGTATLSGGVATLAVTSLPVGTETVTASYSGDGANASSVASTGPSETIGKATPTIALTSSASSARQGTAVVLKVRLTGTTGVPPTGTVTFFSGSTSLGTVTLVNGFAALSVSTLAVGTDSLTVQYSGDGNNSTITSTALSQTITTAPTATTTVASASPASANAGASVTLSATVAGATSGTVSFFVGTTFLGSATVTSGHASVAVTNLPVGANAVTATYSGTASLATSVSAPVTVTIANTGTPSSPPGAGTSTTALSLSPASSTAGAPVVLTATVTNAIAGATVTFFNGTTMLGSVSLAAGSSVSASLTVANLPTGSNSLTAVYGAPGVSSHSSAIVETVSKASSTVALVPSATQITQGGSILLTARVASAGTLLPTQTVTFFNGSTSLGTVTLVNGLATLSVSSLPVGSDSLTVVYSGDGNTATATSAAVAVNVLATSTTSLTAITNHQAVLTATVAGSAPGGSVSFYNGSTLIGTAQVSNGTARLTLPSLTVASGGLTAVYSGDGVNAGSSSAAVSALAAATKNTVTVSVRGALPNVPTTITATVAGANPTGTVAFLDGGGTLLGIATLSGGVATLTASLPAGLDNVKAVYLGDAVNAGASAQTGWQTVLPPAATLSLVSPTQIVRNGTIEVQVLGSNPTGVVSLYDGAEFLATVAVTGGYAIFSGLPLDVGSDDLTAVYSGDGNNGTSTVDIPLTVTDAVSSVTVAAIPMGFDAKNTVLLLTAQVSGSRPTGTVTFYDGDTPLGDPVQIFNGVASLTLTNLPAGVFNLTAVYSGDDNNTASNSDVLTETILAEPVAVTLTPSSGMVAPDGSLTLTASIAGNTPTGTVVFKSGDTVLGTAPVVNDGLDSTATLFLSNVTQPIGDLPITAYYLGDSDDAATASETLTEIVGPAATSLSVVAPGPISQAGSVSVLVSGANPGGVVTFLDGDVVLGMAEVGANGVATLPGLLLPLGTNTLWATYSGDAGNATSVMSFGQTVTASVIPTSTALTVAPQGSEAQNTAVLLTASVTGSGSVPPSGTVEFYNGQTYLGSADLVDGYAALSVNSLPVGTAGLTAVYVGDAVNATSTSAAVSEEIDSEPVNIALTGSPNLAATGGSLTLTATLTGEKPTGTVTFTVDGTALTPVAVVDGVATLTLSDIALLAGSHSITASYSGDTANPPAESDTLTQLVAGAPTTLSPGSPSSIPQSGTISVQVSGSAPGGTVTFFDGQVVLGTAVVQPNGVAKLQGVLLPLGTATFTAVYSGDSSNASSVLQFQQTVTQAPTQTTLAVSPTVNVAPNTPVVLTATISGAAPGGTVTFKDGSGNVVGTASVENGVATLALLGLAAQTAHFTAEYSGDSNNTASTSATVTEQIIGFPTSVTLSSSATLLNQGDNVTLTATVHGDNPGGEVEFLLGSVVLDTQPIVNGVATSTIATSQLQGGTNAITAVYLGDNQNASSASSAVTEIFGLNSTQMQATPTGSLAEGGTVTVNLSGAVNPTGTVTLFYGTLALGTAVVNNLGVAIFTNIVVPAGADTLTATYSGDTRNASSVYSFNETIAPLGTTTTLSATPVQRGGQSVVLTATVASNTAGLTTPNGTVTFYNNGTAIGTAQVVNGYALLTVNAPASGSYNYTASYGNDSYEAASTSSAIGGSVPAEPTGIVLSSSPVNLPAGGTATLTATVYGNNPTGQIIFKQGATVLKTVTMTSGVTTYSVTVSLSSSANIVAVYQDGSGNSINSEPVGEAVQPVLGSASSQNLSTNYVYDADGRLIASVDPLGYLTTYTYDSAGREIETVVYATPAINFGTAQFAQTLTNARNAGTATALVPTSNVADVKTYTIYNNENQVVGTIDGDGYLTETTYTNGLVASTIRYATKVTQPITANSTIAQLRPSATGALTTTYSYDGLGRLAAEVDATGSKTVYSYDADNNVTSKTIAFGTGAAATMGSQYDAQGQLIKATSPDGEATTYAYDAAGRMTSSTDANGNKTVYFYDAGGRLADTVDPDGNVTGTSYNALGQVASTTRYMTQLTAANLSTLQSAGGGLLSTAQATTLNALNSAVTASATNNTTRYFYDTDGRQVFEIDPAGIVTQSGYDAFGRLVSVSTYVQPVVVANIPSQYLPLTTGNLGQYLHDTQGGNFNPTTIYVYDADGRLTATIDPLSFVTTRTYDAAGDLTSVTRSAKSLAAQATTDNVNLGTEEANYLAGTDASSLQTLIGHATSATGSEATLYFYDDDGRQIYEIDPAGVVTQSGYNAEGEVVSVSTYVRPVTVSAIPTPLTAANVTSYLISTGRTADFNPTTIYMYDGDGRLTATIDPLSFVTTRQYDAAGNLTSITRVARSLDAQDTNIGTDEGNYLAGTDFTSLQTAITTATAAGGSEKTTYVYNADGRQIYEIDPAGVLTQSVYNADGQLIAASTYVRPVDITAITQPLTPANVAKYLTNNGLTTDANPTTIYVYDADGQLTATIDPLSYVTYRQYDAAGNLVAVTRAARSLAAQDANYSTYEGTYLGGNGSSSLLTTIKNAAASAGSEMTLYAYDGDGREVGIVDPTGALTQIVYNSQGQVIGKVAFTKTINVASLLATKPIPSLTDMIGALPAGTANQNETSIDVYNADGELSFSIDPAGRVTGYSYDAFGNVISSTRDATLFAAGTTSVEQAAAFNYFVSFTSGVVTANIASNAADETSRYVYDADNRLTFSANALGDVTGQSYDAFGNVIQTIAYANQVGAGTAPSAVVNSTSDRITQMAYDADGQLIYTMDGLGDTTKVSYDAFGNVVQTLEFASVFTVSRTLQTLASFNTATSSHVNDASNRVSSAVYDADNRQTYAIDAAHDVTEFVYDDFGRTVASIAYASTTVPLTGPANAGSTDRITVYQYDADGNQTYVMDAGGYVTQNSYDAFGRVTQTEDFYNPEGAPVSVLAAAVIKSTAAPDLTPVSAVVTTASTLDRTTSYQYDQDNRLTKVTDPLNYTQSYTYDAYGDKTSYTNQNSATWIYGYDADGELATETDPTTLVAAAEPAVNANGDLNAATATSVAIVTTMSYDAFGDVTSRSVGASGSTATQTIQWVYDADGHQIETLDPLSGVYNAGDLASLNSDGAGASARTETSVILSSEVTYDAFGDAVANIDAAGNITAKVYDADGHVIDDVDALGDVTAYGYDAFGDQTKLTRYANALVNATALSSYANGAGHVVSTITNLVPATPGSLDRVITTTYDALGRSIQVTQPATWVDNGNGSSQNASEITKTSYDAFGDVTQSQVQVDATTWATTSYYYNQLGQRIGTVDPLNYLTTDSYDRFGNMLVDTQYAVAQPGWTPGSALIANPFGNDRVTRYTYNKDDEETSQTLVDVAVSTFNAGSHTASTSPATAMATISYNYDGVGNRISATDAAGNTTYTYYDALNRVVAVAQPTISDAVVNAASNAEQIQAVTPLTRFIYDAFGNVVEQVAYGDYTGNPSSVTPSNMPAATAMDRVTLTRYDGLDHAIETTRTDGANDAPVSTFSSYNAEGLLAKTWQAVTVTLPQSGATTVASDYTAYEYDALGRVTAVITPASTGQYSGGTTKTVSQVTAGSVVSDSAYDAFGDVIKSGSFTTTTPGSWTAQYQTFSSFDNAGHEWRTNSDTGVYTVSLYDLAGFKTATITSAGQLGGSGNGVDLSTYANAQTVDGLTYNQVNEQVSRTNYIVDVEGRVTQEILPYRIEAAGQTVGGAPSISQSFDRWGNMTEQTNPVGGAAAAYYAYDYENRETAEFVSTVSPFFATDYIETQFFYDIDGREIATEDGDGQTHTNGVTYNADGQVSEQYNADGGGTINEYDAFGDVTQTDTLVNSNAALDATSYHYDDLGRMTEEIQGELADWTTHQVNLAISGVKVYSDDGSANAVSASSFEIVTKISYDQIGDRVAQDVGAEALGINGSTGGITGDSYFTNTVTQTWDGYDLRGNVITALTGDDNLADFNAPGAIPATHYAYDAENHLVAETDADGKSTNWTYDAFGVLDSKVDLAAPGDSGPGSTTYTYNHDNAGLLVSVKNSGFSNATQQQVYVYNAAGELLEETDYGAGQVAGGETTFYDYDAAGHHVAEATTDGGTVVQDQILSYDVYGRLSELNSVFNTITETFSYDKAGNLLHEQIQQPYSDPNVASFVQDLYFAYDAMNRELLVDGSQNDNAADLSNIAPAVAKPPIGHILSYDLAGDRITDMSWGAEVALGYSTAPQGPGNPQADAGDLGTPAIVSQPGDVTEKYSYDAMGRLSQVSTPQYSADVNNFFTQQSTDVVLADRYYDAASRVVENGGEPFAATYSSFSNAYIQKMSDNNPDAPGLSTTYTGYDSFGRTSIEKTQWFGTTASTGSSQNATINFEDSNGDGYDADGNLLRYTEHQSGETITTVIKMTDEGTLVSNAPTTIYDGFQQGSLTTTIVNGGGTTSGTTTNSFDYDGELVQVQDNATGSIDSRTLINDAAGHVLRTDAAQAVRGGPLTYEVVEDGQVTGVYNADQDGNIDFNYSFDLAFSPISANNPATTTGNYVVQAGDTLQSIALNAYGDASFWYLIADANGISADGDLQLGEVLTIPPIAGSNQNNVNTVAPYNSARIVGSLLPQVQPAPLPAPQGSDGGCGIVGEIVMLVVTAVVTYFTAGATSELLEAELGIDTAAAGATSLGVVAADAIGGVVGGAVGSLVGQATGNLLGIQKGINWDQVGIAAISGGLGAGGSAPPLFGSEIAGAVAQAAIVDAETQGIAVAVGLQKSFSWAEVAGAAVGAGVTSAYAQYAPTTGSTFADGLIGGTVGGVAKGITAAAVQGGQINLASIATDAFGNALGDALAHNDWDDGSSSPSSQTAEASNDRSGAWNAVVSGQDQVPMSAEALARELAPVPTSVPILGENDISTLPALTPDQLAAAVPTLTFASSSGGAQQVAPVTEQIAAAPISITTLSEADFPASAVNVDDLLANISTFGVAGGAAQNNMIKSVMLGDGLQFGHEYSSVTGFSPLDPGAPNLSGSLSSYDVTPGLGVKWGVLGDDKVLSTYYGVFSPNPDQFGSPILTQATDDQVIGINNYLSISSKALSEQVFAQGAVASVFEVLGYAGAFGKAGAAGEEAIPATSEVVPKADTPPDPAAAPGTTLAVDGAAAIGVTGSNGGRIVTFQRSDLSVMIDPVTGEGEAFVIAEGQKYSIADITNAGRGPQFDIDTNVVTSENESIKLKLDGGSVTTAILEDTIAQYKKINDGSAPEGLDGFIIKSNLENLQSEYVQAQQNNPGISDEAAANIAARNISFGNSRIAVGYGDIEAHVFASGEVPVNINGVWGAYKVPTQVYITAQPTK